MHELRLLGPVQVTREAMPVRGFESRKAMALFCYLALRGEPVSREHLAGLFWGDKTTTHALGNLSRVRNNLAQLFPGLVAGTRATIELVRTKDFWIDAAAFDEKAGKGTPEGRAEAVTLYRGDLLSDLFLKDSPDFEIWMLGERERWRQRVLQLLQDLIRVHQANNDPVRALDFSVRLLEIDPLHEETHRARMVLLAQTGQRTAALEQYELCRRVLGEELGVEPTAETTRLYQEIRSGEIDRKGKRWDQLRQAQVQAAPGERKSPFNNLPPERTSFVGRESELAEIAARMGDPACRLLTLVGPGGMGKTRLAVHAGSQAQGMFTDGVLFVALATLNSPREILTAMAKQLKLAPDPKGLDKLVLDWLRPRHMLVVLDNYEHLLDGAELAREILDAAPRVKVLVTSREPLDLEMEWRTEVRGLGLEAPVPEGELGPDPAVQLFFDRANRISTLATRQAQRDCVKHLVTLVAGMPLAIELAAARIRELSCENMVDELERGTDLLATTMRDVVPRHKSLRAVLDWSYDRLSPSHQALFRRLAVFAGGWSPEAAQAVCAGEELSTAHIPSAQTSLLHKSLLEPELARGLMRYRLLEPVRQYSLVKLAANPSEEARARNQHLTWFLELVRRAEAELIGPNQVVWLERLDHEHDNLRAALDWALDHAPVLALELVVTLWWFWRVRGYLAEGKGYIVRVLGRVDESAPMLLRARALYAEGSLAYYQGDLIAAQSAYEASLALSSGVDNKREMANALHGLGAIAQSRGNYAGARAHYEQSLGLNREIADRAGEAGSLLNLGFVALHRADYAEASLRFEQSLELYRKLGNTRAIAVLLGNMGLVAYYQKEYAEARDLLTESLALCRELGDKLSTAVAYDNLGYLELKEGNYDRAELYLRSGLVLYREVGSKRNIADILIGFAGLAVERAAAVGQGEARGLMRRGVHLSAAARRLFEELGTEIEPVNRELYETYLERARSGLAPQDFESAWVEGRALEVEDAVALALAGAASK